jgi:type IV secretion system protein VirB5
MRKILSLSVLPIILCSIPLGPARAQWAVIDVQAIAQLMQQVQTMQQQLLVAQSQLQQARQELGSITGQRGMQMLLSGIDRNYLPTSISQLTSALQGGGAYPFLARDVRSLMISNAVLTPAQLAALAPADRSQIVAARQSAALRQSIAQEALGNSSNRFATLQTLIAAIGGAKDQKAILELEARMSAELGMLQNEQTKLQVLAQTMQAQDAANASRERESALLAQGQFATRFEPAP